MDSDEELHPLGEEEKNEKKSSLGVYLILAIKFFDKFAFTGTFSVLTVYMIEELNLSEKSALMVYHSSYMLSYFLSLFIAWLSEGSIGKFRVIIFSLILYCLGPILLGAASIRKSLVLSIISLLIMAFGVGGLKPVLAAFGGDQFAENDTLTRQNFYSRFALALNLGSLVALIISPLIHKIQCFDNDCYMLSFGIPAMLGLLLLILFAYNKNGFNNRISVENTFTKTICCIFLALKNKFKNSEPKEYWLLYAENEYDREFIQEVRSLLSLPILLIPIPMYWALFHQVGSNWTIQAMKMNGKTFFGTIAPDQMQVLNPIFNLILIPLFNHLIYPLFSRCRFLTKPLQRMSAGILLCGASFIIAGLLEMQIENRSVNSSQGNQSSLTVINNSPCSVSFSSKLQSNILIENGENYAINLQKGNYSFIIEVKPYEFDNSSTEYEFQSSSNTVEIVFDISDPSLMKFYSNPDIKIDHENGFNIDILTTSNERSFNSSNFDKSFINQDVLDQEDVNEFNMFSDGDVQSRKILLVPLNETRKAGICVSLSKHIIHQSDKLSILLQIPQQFVLAISEVLLLVTFYSFSYDEASPGLKSVVSSIFYLTVGIGNIITLIIFAYHSSSSSIFEYFLFSGLTFLFGFIFIILSHFYQYRNELEI